MDKKLRIGLADDHDLVRTGFKLLIESEPDLRVIFEAGTLLEIRARLETHGAHCDLLVLDVDFEESRNGLDALKEIKGSHPRVKVLLLTISNEEKYFRQGMALGADGYLLKKDMGGNLIHAIRRLCSGGVFVTPNASSLRVSRDVSSPAYRLSERELEVVRLMGSGLTSREIGESLGISERTVDNHKQRIYRRLGMKNAPALISFAKQSGII